jgi:hypothetical protein
MTILWVLLMGAPLEFSVGLVAEGKSQREKKEKSKDGSVGWIFVERLGRASGQPPQQINSRTDDDAAPWTMTEHLMALSRRMMPLPLSVSATRAIAAQRPPLGQPRAPPSSTASLWLCSRLTLPPKHTPSSWMARRQTGTQPQ